MIFTARFISAFLLCILLFACRGKNDIPVSPAVIAADSLIPPDKMVLILADVHVVEASLMLERNTGAVPAYKPGFLYQGIFSKYHISSDRYDRNLVYYRQNPENFAKMYEKVIVILEDREKRITGKK